MARKVVFVVQGEGRGHLSQALAMNHLLSEMDCELVAVFVGRSSVRELPSYFLEQLKVEPREFQSPNFLTDKDNQGIRVAYSIWLSALRLPKYIRTSIRLATEINDINPELVINFYDPLVGLSQLFKRIKAPIISIAHQYLVLHPEFEMPKRPRGDKFGLRLLTYISQIGSTQNLALSFYDFPDFPKRKMKVVPPLFRSSLLAVNPSHQDFILVYLLNSGYAAEVINWQKLNPNEEIHCFWDRADKENPYSPQPNLYFHQLSETLFIEKMAACKALVTTSGFESVCEAMYLNKPVAMVPVKGHYEQKLNSYDAVRAGAGVRNDTFQFDQLMRKLHSHTPSKEEAEKTHQWFSDMKLVFQDVISGHLN